MTRSEILEEIKKLDYAGQLAIIGDIVNSLQQNYDVTRPRLSREERARRLGASAEIMKEVYEQDYYGERELTAFTALDGEDLLEYPDEGAETDNEPNQTTEQEDEDKPFQADKDLDEQIKASVLLMMDYYRDPVNIVFKELEGEDFYDDYDEVDNTYSSTLKLNKGN